MSGDVQAVLKTLKARSGKAGLDYHSSKVQPLGNLDARAAGLPKPSKKRLSQEQIFNNITLARGRVYLEAFRLLCTYDEELSKSKTLPSIESALLMQLGELDRTPLYTAEQGEAALYTFIASIVLILKKAKLKQAEKCLNQAVSVVQWQQQPHHANTTLCSPGPDDYHTIQHDTPANGMSKRLQQEYRRTTADDNHQPDSSAANQAAMQSRPAWFHKLAPWLQHYLQSVTKQDKSLKSLNYNLPPHLRSLPGLCNFLRHSFYVFDDKNRLARRSHRYRASNIVPFDMQLSREQLIEATATNIKDFVETQYSAHVQKLARFSKDSSGKAPTIVPLPISIQSLVSPSLANFITQESDVEEIKQLAIARLKALDYKEPRAAQVDGKTRWVQINLMDSNKPVNALRQSLLLTKHLPRVGRAWLAKDSISTSQYHAAVNDYLLYVFPTLANHLPDGFELPKKRESMNALSENLWTADDSKAVLDAAQKSNKERFKQSKDNLTLLLRALEAYSSAYHHTTSRRDQLFNMTLSKASLENILVSTMGGCALSFCMRGMDRASVAMMHTDSMLEFYERSATWGKKERYFPPVYATKDTEDYQRFCQIFAGNILSGHHARVNESTAEAALGVKSLYSVLPGDVIKHVLHLEKLSALDSIIQPLAMTKSHKNKLNFHCDLKPTNSDNLDQCWDALIRTYTDYATDKLKTIEPVKQRFCELVICLNDPTMVDMNSDRAKAIQNALGQSKDWPRYNGIKKDKASIKQKILIKIQLMKSLQNTERPLSEQTAVDTFKQFQSELLHKQRQVLIPSKSQLRKDCDAWLLKMAEVGYPAQQLSPIKHKINSICARTKSITLHFQERGARLRRPKGYLHVCKPESLAEALQIPLEYLGKLYNMLMVKSQIQAIYKRAEDLEEMQGGQASNINRLAERLPNRGKRRVMSADVELSSSVPYQPVYTRSSSPNDPCDVDDDEDRADVAYSFT